MATNLIVPIEMVGRGISSLSASATTFARTSTPLNPANYDGATYYFEVLGYNANVSNAYSPVLYDLTNAADKASVSVPASTTSVTRLRSTSFTPAAGNNTYQVRLPQTGSDNDLRVFAARIVIVQADATKTRIQIPLISGGYNAYSSADSSTGATDSTQSTSYAQTIAQYFGMWKRTAADFETIDDFDFEAVHCSNNASGTATVGLYNASDAAIVAATELASASTSWVVQSANFTTDADFDDLDSFDVRHKISNASYYSFVAMASLYLNISDLTKGEVYWRVSRSSAAGTAANNLLYDRVKLDTSGYSAPVVYAEATAVELTSPEAALELRDHSTNDSGSSGATTVTNSTLTVPTTKGVVRSASALTGLTDGNRIIGRQNASTYSVTQSHLFIVVQYTGSGVAAPVLVAEQSGSSILVSWS